MDCDCGISVHVIVATPGRLLDLLNKNLIKTDECKVLILDEVKKQVLLRTYIPELRMRSAVIQALLESEVQAVARWRMLGVGMKVK